METTVHEQRRTYQNRIWLERFWKRGIRGRMHRAKRLALLREYAAIVLVDDPFVPHDTRRARRQFEKRKADQAFYLGGSCWVCGMLAECRHHILQIRHGGRNTKRNIVNLCQQCHVEVHRTAPDARPETAL